MIYTIYPIRKNSNFLPVIAGIALMTITACASANLGEFSKATQDAAIAAAVEAATATATDAATKAAADAADAQKRAVDSVRAELECTDPVCDNVVNTADLPSYPTAAASDASAFLTITGTQIDATGVTRLVSGQRVAPALRGSARAGDNMDGFRYFQGQFNEAGDTRYFAGILPTTNLGAPLTSAPAETEWDGFYSYGGVTPARIEFDIDFANRRITALDEPTGFRAISFDLRFSDSGVISGIVLQHSGFTGDTDIGGLANATGLIGTEGLVGAFVQNDLLPTDFSGGFVADNPDTN